MSNFNLPKVLREQRSVDDTFREAERNSTDDIRSSPTLLLGRVTDFDPATGMCDVSLLGYDSQVRAPILMSFGSTCGTPYDDRYDNEYYSSRTKKYGTKKVQHVTEGEFRTIPIDSLVVLFSGSSHIPGKDGHTFYVIIGSISFPQLESFLGRPIRNATKEARFGDSSKVGKRGERESVHYKDYEDEVGWTEEERKVMAKDYNPDDAIPNEVIPHTSPDTWYALRRMARSKETVGPTIFGTPVTLFGGRYRFIDRERLDARRLEGKYHVNKNVSNEVNVIDVSGVTSEVLFKIDKQGKIILGADLKGTLVECFCSDEDEYRSWDRIDAGSFVTMGTSAGVQYTEISSRDWMFNRFSRGITKFDRSWRIHGHDHGSQHRNTFFLPSQEFISEAEIGDKTGVKYIEANYLILDVGHLQIKADRILLDVNPATIFWKQFDLTPIFGI